MVLSRRGEAQRHGLLVITRVLCVCTVERAVEGISGSIACCIARTEVRACCLGLLNAVEHGTDGVHHLKEIGMRLRNPAVAKLLVQIKKPAYSALNVGRIKQFFGDCQGNIVSERAAQRNRKVGRNKRERIFDIHWNRFCKLPVRRLYGALAELGLVVPQRVLQAIVLNAREVDLRAELHETLLTYIQDSAHHCSAQIAVIDLVSSGNSRQPAVDVDLSHEIECQTPNKNYGTARNNNDRVPELAGTETLPQNVDRSACEQQHGQRDEECARRN